MTGDYGVRVPSTGKPKFVMVGIDRPDGSVRLFATRDVKDAAWGQRDNVSVGAYSSVTAWHIDADMVNVLVIDKPTWGEAFARAFEIWANHDRNAEIEATARALDKARTQRRALKDGPAHPDRTGTEVTDGTDTDH